MTHVKVKVASSASCPVTDTGNQPTPAVNNSIQTAPSNVAPLYTVTTEDASMLILSPLAELLTNYSKCC